jgi:hypothetical protein
MPYTPIITPADLNNIYPEILDEITRADGGTLAAEAIDIAIAEAKMYLTRYDLVKIFGDSVTDVASIFADPYLTRLIKDLAVWQLIQLANPSINYEVYEKRYAHRFPQKNPERNSRPPVAILRPHRRNRTPFRLGTIYPIPETQQLLLIAQLFNLIYGAQ